MSWVTRYNCRAVIVDIKCALDCDIESIDSHGSIILAHAMSGLWIAPILTSILVLIPAPVLAPITSGTSICLVYPHTPYRVCMLGGCARLRGVYG